MITYAYTENWTANLVCWCAHKLSRHTVHGLVYEIVRRKHL